MGAVGEIAVLLAFVGMYVCLFAFVPRAVNALTWAGCVAFMSWLGPILQLDDWILKLSVMEHLASPPVEEIKIAPLVVVAVIGIWGVIIGVLRSRQRDVSGR